MHSKFIALTIFFVFFSFNCHCVDLSPEETAILDGFFRTLWENSEGGYVQHGKKPVCIHGFFTKECYNDPSEFRASSVYLKQGADLLKKLDLKSSNPNIIIHIYDREDSLVAGCKHILVINKKLFIQTVRNNLPLFQYVLGPDVTPTKLLDKLIDPEAQFHCVMKNDKVLIGIILGFGTQNSIHCSRMENIDDAMFLAEQPPFKSELSQFEKAPQQFRTIVLINDNPKKPSKILPSFGYRSLKEERIGLAERFDVTSERLVNHSPAFIFGRLKDDNESNKFIAELECTQTKIIKQLASEDFLDNLLKLLYPADTINIAGSESKVKQLSFNEWEIKQLPLIIATNIWNMIDEETVDYQKAFIEGVKDSDKMNAKHISVNTIEYAKAKGILQIQENIRQADSYFTLLDETLSVHPIVPSRLYYKTIKEGSGRVLNDETNVFVHYTFKDPNDAVIVDTWMAGTPVKLNLSETISGFAGGIKGMKIGEIREIYIHPSLAYGVFTTMEKGIYLKASVQLIAIEEDQTGSTSRELILANMDINLYANQKEYNDQVYQELEKKVGYACGYNLWQHYKKGQEYSLQQVLIYLAEFQSGKEVDMFSEKSQEIFNRLHWNIYTNCP